MAALAAEVPGQLMEVQALEPSPDQAQFRSSEKLDRDKGRAIPKSFSDRHDLLVRRS